MKVDVELIGREGMSKLGESQVRQESIEPPLSNGRCEWRMSCSKFAKPMKAQVLVGRR